MRDLTWRLGLTLTALGFVFVLGPGISCSLGSRLIEQVRGQTPQAQIDRYLDAASRGDRQAALDLWTLWRQPDAKLETRRASVTSELLALGPDIGYQIQKVEWWRTCCEPGVIENPDEAGGARVRIKLQDGAIYVFDVLVPGGYWGSAMGNPVRTWTIVDVYPESLAPLAWPFTGWD
jgi:hypothetical protein